MDEETPAEEDDVMSSDEEALLMNTPDILLDEDFNYLLGFVPALFKTISNDKEKSRCERWLDKLLGLRAHTLADKRERNLYLVNLLLNIGRGKLVKPFDKNPPHTLEPGITLFAGKIAPDVCYNDLNLEVEDYAEYSQESRTFFAAKALPGGKGAFGYVAVSLGGGDAMWLDCKGNDIDPSTLSRRNPCKLETKEDDEILEKLKNVLSKRSPQKDRSELLPYYLALMERIKEIQNAVGTECEIYDPAIEKMIEDLQMDVIAEGKIHVGEIGNIDKRNWLCTLQKKIKRLMEAAERRELTLNYLEKVLVEHERDHLTFLDISNAVKPPKLDPILAEAVRDRPSDYNVALLRRNYPEETVNVFLRLLETEKMYVVNQERMIYDQFVMNMRREVLNEARIGMEKYNTARKELQRVSKVINKIEEVKKRIFKEKEKPGLPGETEQHENEHLLDNEIEDAKARVEVGQAQSDKIEAKIAKLHDQIHQLTSDFHKMEEEGRRELDYQLKEISDLRSQVGSQDRKLYMLKMKLQESPHANQDLSSHKSPGCKPCG